MQKSNYYCPKCGGMRSPDVLNGLCQECLGRLALSVTELSIQSEAVYLFTQANLPGFLAENPPVAAPVPLGCLGEYELLEEIGRGGMGTVYRAWHRRLNRTVALKAVESAAIFA